MKFLMINVVCGIRSTGRICTDIALALEKKGHEVKIAYGREKVPKEYIRFAHRIGTDFDVKLHALGSRLFDMAGLGSIFYTKKFIEWIEEYNPDVIYLHNIHGYYINYEVLFKYLKRSQKKIFWSLYDCWSFTGHCAHFDYNNCNKWNDNCRKCKFSSEYPKSYISRSERNFAMKKSSFIDIPNLTIITPSQWLCKLVKKSFLNNYPIEIMPNGIDVSRYKKKTITNRNKYGIKENQFVLLGVSSRWTREKGLNFMISLSEMLDEDITVVMVGKIDDKEKITNNIIHIEETNNVEELCEIYSMSDTFINPTLQETQGLTTLEAMACGIPCIVFNSGGAAECMDCNTGFVVEKNDFQTILKYINLIKRKVVVFDSEKLISKANSYDIKKMYDPILKLLCEEA